MIDHLELLTLLENLPIVEALTWIFGLFWLIFSFAMTYHWILYSRNIVMTALVLTLYYGVSLFLIGIIITQIPYV